MKKLCATLFSLFFLTGVLYGQAEKTAPPVTPSLPAADANKLITPVQPGEVQQGDNVIYYQNRSSTAAYQQLQVQTIQKTANPSAPVPEKQPANVQASNVLQPDGQLAGQASRTVIVQDATQQTQPFRVTSSPVPLSITAEQAEDQDFPFFDMPEPARRITEKRVDLRNLTPNIVWQKQILDNAKAVAIIIEKNKLHAVTDSIYQLDIGITLGQQFKLCPGTPFLDQPVIGIGTAFIINEQTLVTASHVFLEDLDRYAVVFGFEMVNKAGAYEGLIPLKDIYFPTRIVQNSETLDIAVFEVSRPLERPALKYSLCEAPPIYSPIYMIGHPYGLPKKVALNADIQSAGQEEYFYTSLFASQGNSGSPVFELATNKVIGVLVSGEIDYTWNGNCNTSMVCKIPYCKGEKVISISALPQVQELVEMAGH